MQQQSHRAPPSFAQSAEVNEVLCKFPKLTLTLMLMLTLTLMLTHVMRTAGFTTPTAMKTEGLPEDACLVWILCLVAAKIRDAIGSMYPV